MDFEYTEAQRDLSGLARDLFAGHAANTTGFDPDLWRAMAAAGLLDAALPEPAGGAGFDVLEQCAILIELGRTLAPAPYATGIAVAAATIARFGDASQVRRWVGPVLAGETTIAPATARAAVAFEAERQGELWRVDGVQPVVAAGAFAGTFLVEARSGADSILLLVDRDTDGVSVTAQPVVDGHDAALLELRDVVVGPAHALTDPAAAAWARRRALLATCAHQLGVLTRALELTCEYARTREQFGKPIGTFQAVRQRLADAYIDVEAVRLTLWQAAWRESRGLPADSALAVAKFWAAEAGHRVAHTCVHVHASTGIYQDYPMQRYFLAAKRAEFESGSATCQLRGLGVLLAAEPADA